MKSIIILFLITIVSCGKSINPPPTVYLDSIRAGDITGECIHFTKIEPVPQVFGDNYNELIRERSYDLDINQDGRGDYNFRRIRKHDATTDSLWTTLTPLQENKIIVQVNSDLVMPIPLFDEISEASNWTNQSSILLLDFVTNGEKVSTGLWPGIEKHYVGTRTVEADGVSFGWIRITMAEMFGNTLVVVDFATIEGK